MAMSQSERLRLIQEQANKFVSRNRCVDSSLLTMQKMYAASKNVAPVAVAGQANVADCATNVTYRGKGTNMDQSALIAGAAGCAVCPTTAPADTGVTPMIILPTPCVNYATMPFAQKNISTIYPAPYTEPCSVPGTATYFPAPIYDGSNCTYNRITTPSG